MKLRLKSLSVRASRWGKQGSELNQTLHVFLPHPSSPKESHSAKSQTPCKPSLLKPESPALGSILICPNPHLELSSRHIIESVEESFMQNDFL